MKCEICGEREAVKKVVIEGATLWVCERCGGGLPRVKEKRPPKAEEVIEEVVENYGQKIKQAMEAHGYDEESLAKKLGEKLSFLKRVIKEEVLPPDPLIKKLEKELGIHLRTKHVVEHAKPTKIEEPSLAEFDLSE